jgi:hypothetical protein
LRVRIKELAQEARYIRLEENKIKSKQKIMQPIYNWDAASKVGSWYRDKNSSDFLQLRAHRTHEVRDAARAAQLAYGFLREVPYKVIEPKTYTDKYKMDQIKKEVKRLATKFGGLGYGKNYDNEVDQWFDA